MAGKGNFPLKICNIRFPCGMTGARCAATRPNPPQTDPQPQSGPQQGRDAKESQPSTTPPLRQNPKCLFGYQMCNADHSSGDQVSATDNNNNWALMTRIVLWMIA